MQSRQPKFSRMSALRPPPFPCVIGQPAAAATRCHMGKEEGQEIKISFHCVKWSRPACRRAWRGKLGAERLGKCGSDLLHRRYEAAYAFLRTDRFAEHHHVHA